MQLWNGREISRARLDFRFAVLLSPQINLNLVDLKLRYVVGVCPVDNCESLFKIFHMWKIV